MWRSGGIVVSLRAEQSFSNQDKMLQISKAVHWERAWWDLTFDKSAELLKSGLSRMWMRQKEEEWDKRPNCRKPWVWTTYFQKWPSFSLKGVWKKKDSKSFTNDPLASDIICVCLCVCRWGPVCVRYEPAWMCVLEGKSQWTSSPHSPSGVAVAFLRSELEGARLVGPCWCSGDFTMADMIICWRAVAGFAELLWSLYWSAGVGILINST